MTLALAGTRVGAESDARLFAAHAPTRLSPNTTHTKRKPSPVHEFRASPVQEDRIVRPLALARMPCGSGHLQTKAGAPGVEPDTRWPYGAEGVGARADADETRSEEAPAEAAVDGDGGAGDVAAAGRDEERDHRRRVLRAVHVTEGDPACELARQGLGEPDDAHPGGDREAETGDRLDRRECGDVDDAARPPRPQVRRSPQPSSTPGGKRRLVELRFALQAAALPNKTRDCGGPAAPVSNRARCDRRGPARETLARRGRARPGAVRRLTGLPYRRRPPGLEVPGRDRRRTGQPGRQRVGLPLLFCSCPLDGFHG